MGLKKAWDVRVGTWLLLMELAGRAPCDELPTLPVKLTRFPDSPRRKDPCIQGLLCEEDNPVLAVPGRDVPSETSALFL
jgi:hypothetical protein